MNSGERLRPPQTRSLQAEVVYGSATPRWLSHASQLAPNGGERGNPMVAAASWGEALDERFGTVQTSVGERGSRKEGTLVFSVQSCGVSNVVQLSREKGRRVPPGRPATRVTRVVETGGQRDDRWARPTRVTAHAREWPGRAGPRTK